MNTNQALTKEQLSILATILDQKYAGSIGKRSFGVESHCEGPVILVKVTLRDANGSFEYPVEARMNFEEQDLTVTEARDFLLDYIDTYFDEYLGNDEEIYLTIDWSDYESDGFDLQMRGQVLNTHLELMADELLSGKTIDLENLSGKILN